MVVWAKVGILHCNNTCQVLSFRFFYFFLFGSLYFPFFFASGNLCPGFDSRFFVLSLVVFMRFVFWGS